MKLFAPERPTYDPSKGDAKGEPKLIHPRVGPVGRMPTLYVRPNHWNRQPDGIPMWEIVTHVPVNPNAFGFRTTAQLTALEIAEVLAEWEEDPEGTLTRRFGHTWPWESGRTTDTPGRPRKEAAPIVPDLADLGL